jgi:hypothetical protein
MLAGRKQDAASHQRRRVTTMGHRFNVGRNLKPTQVGAPEYVARVGRCGHESDMHLDSGMEPDAVSFNC